MSITEVLERHYVSPLNESGWFCFNCRSDLGYFRGAIEHQAEALSAAGYGKLQPTNNELVRVEG